MALVRGSRARAAVTRARRLRARRRCAARSGIALPTRARPDRRRALEIAHAANVEISLWDDTFAGAGGEHGAPRYRHPGARQDRHRCDAPGNAGRGRAAHPRPLRRNAGTDLAGVFSHLAAAEELDSTFTHEQLAKFAAATDGCNASIERHIAASAAAMLWPRNRLDAVRRIAIYGQWPSPETAAAMRERDGFTLEPALTWRTQVVAVHDVPAHPGRLRLLVSRKRPSRIAVLPIGCRGAAARCRRPRVRPRRRPVPRRRTRLHEHDLRRRDRRPSAATGTTVTLIGADGDAFHQRRRTRYRTGHDQLRDPRPPPRAHPRTYLETSRARCHRRAAMIIEASSPRQVPQPVPASVTADFRKRRVRCRGNRCFDGAARGPRCTRRCARRSGPTRPAPRRPRRHQRRRGAASDPAARYRFNRTPANAAAAVISWATRAAIRLWVARPRECHCWSVMMAAAPPGAVRDAR